MGRRRGRRRPAAAAAAAASPPYGPREDDDLEAPLLRAEEEEEEEERDEIRSRETKRVSFEETRADDDDGEDDEAAALTAPLLGVSRDADVVDVDDDAAAAADDDDDAENVPYDDDDDDDDAENVPYDDARELRAIWTLGWPMFVSYFCRMAMASTDAIMVGHYKGGKHSPGDYLAAAALSDMLTTLLVVPPLAFNQVLNALCGQAAGAGAKRVAGVWLQQSVFWLAVTMTPTLVGFFFVKDALLGLGFDPAISALAGEYARWNVFWPVPNGWYQCMRFYFQAVGRPRPAMYNGVAFLFVNALLNWVFVFGGPFRYLRESRGRWEGFGFVGAAMSLSCSRCAQPLAYWYYMFVRRRAHERYWPRGGWSFRHHTRARTVEFLRQAAPLVGTLVFGVVVGQATTLLVSKLGTDAVAATSAISAATVVWSGAINAMFSMVIAVRVGYHLGRGDGDAARRSFWLSTAVVSATLVAVVIFVAPFAEPVLSLATSDRVVARDAAKVLPVALLATTLGVLNSLCTGGVFSGQGRQTLVTVLSFFVDIPLSVGGVAAMILVFKTNLRGVYAYGCAAAALELLIAYGFVWSSDWKKYASDAKARQAAAAPGEDPPREESREERGRGESSRRSIA